jgi:Icc-related predicted phosphoesterase
MKIVAISDTHNKHKHLTSVAMGSRLPDGDLLIHGGDLTGMGRKHELESVFKWFEQQASRYTHGIVFIAGNHDISFDPKYGEYDIQDELGIGPKQKPIWLRQMLATLPSNVRYLENNDVTIDGVKIWGSPITPWFGGDKWGFNRHRGDDIMETWNQIPEDTNVVVTHGPVAYKLDYVPRNAEYTGCEQLRHVVEQVKPLIHISGHIHEAYGYDYDYVGDGTNYFNASICNHQYEPINNPWEIEADFNLREISGNFIL